MTTITHTPGPWLYDTEDGFIYDCDGRYTVASPHATKELDLDERDANARLIAAAPELLRALVALEDATECDTPDHLLHDKNGALYPAMRQAQEAIRKAKGEA